MAVTLRSTKGSALTYAEMDANFQAIDDLSGGTTAITPNIDGGSIDNTAIGSSNASSGSFTTLKASGNTLVGGSTTIPGTGLTSPRLQVSGTSVTGSSVGISCFNASNPARLSFGRSKDAALATYTTALADGDMLGMIQFDGANGTSFGQAAAIIAYADGDFGTAGDTTDSPGRLVFSTTTNGSGSVTGRLKIDSSGNILNISSGGLGYGTGSGGAVTQGTSRTTPVTLNKTNGAITLVSAAGSTSWQTFTVNNSTVAATDTIHICQKSGTDLNMVHITAVADGSFNVTFATTGGTTTEQPVFNFAIIKGVVT